MTTLVADAKMGYMAGDLMVTANDGDVTIPCDTKIERVEIGGDTYLVGLAGLEGPGEVFMEWFREGEWDEPPEPMLGLDPEDDFSVLVLGPDGIEVADKFMRLTPIHNRWYAVGSGGIHAWSILEAGVGIHKAMGTALRLDPNSGIGYQIRYRDPYTAETEDEDVAV